MREVLLIALPAAMAAAFWCGWRALALLGWRPAVASTPRTDYSELARMDDFWVGNPLFTLRRWNWRDGEHGRLIEDDIFFEDAQGLRHRATVKRRVRRGWRPFSVYTVWYDPADPARVTAFGPGHWLGLALAWGVMAAVIFSLGMRLAAAA